ncbi:hypothetical protein GCM10023190_05730 [Enteractinococcus fodinae]
MFAHTTRIALISTFSLSLIASTMTASHATLPNNSASTSSSLSVSHTVEEMGAEQTPAPVEGEEKEVIEIEGIDAEALPENDGEVVEPPSEETAGVSEPSEEPEESQHNEDQNTEETLNDGDTEVLPEESSSSETPNTEPTPSVSEEASPQSSQPQKSAEEQHLAETALEDSQGTLAAITAPIESIDFVAAGLTWDSDTAETITEAAVRVREQGGWSEWHDLEVHATDEEMKANSPRAGTEPLITLEADAVQARVHTESGVAPEGLEISLIDPGHSVTDGQLEPASPEGEDVETAAEASVESSLHPIESFKTEAHGNASESMSRLTSARAPIQTNRSGSAADAIKPAIVTRAQWGANESVTSTSSQSSDLKAMYVHHTAGTNNYTRAQAYGQVRAIFSYHAESLRWGDIGYNFLIDRYGTIYEGRRGSLDSLPLGAQAGGFNTNTFGISTIGNFDVAQPPAGMVESLKKVLAWKGLQYGINATGTTTLTSAGGTSKHSRGTRVTVNTILGHRDTHATACPGRYLYSQLQAIRKDVSTRISNARASAPNYDTISSGLIYQAKDNTVLRARPTSKSDILRGLPSGTRVTTSNRALNGWWEVTINGTTGWIAHRHFTRYYDTISSGLIYQAKDNTVLRARPTSKSDILRGLPSGTRVTTSNRALNGWWEVTINGTTGWIAHRHFTRSK